MNTTKEAVTFVAVANAFNNINGEVLFHNIKNLCSFVLTYILICYSIPTCLFIVGGKGLLSQGGKT